MKSSITHGIVILSVQVEKSCRLCMFLICRKLRNEKNISRMVSIDGNIPPSFSTISFPPDPSAISLLVSVGASASVSILEASAACKSPGTFAAGASAETSNGARSDA